MEPTTNTHPFNGPLSGTTQVSRYQKGNTNLDFTEARDSEWQWHQLGQMQICTSLQTDNHASTSLLIFYRPDALPATQPTASKHWRQLVHNTKCKLETCKFKVQNWVHYDERKRIFTIFNKFFQLGIIREFLRILKQLATNSQSMLVIAPAR